MRNEQILKLMTSLNMTKEKATAIVEAAERDPKGFAQRQHIIDKMRSTPDTTRRLKGIQLRNCYPMVGRNDPCPCGCGKKFKSCANFKKPRQIGVIVHREPILGEEDIIHE